MSDEAAKEKAELEGRSVAHSAVTLSQVIMPAQTGPGGVYAHGGEIMKMMDAAAGLAALRHSHSAVMTLRVGGINFLTFRASYPMSSVEFSVIQRLHSVGCAVPPELWVSGSMICRVSVQAGWFVS